MEILADAAVSRLWRFRGAAPLTSKPRSYTHKVRKMDFSKPDLIDEDPFNRSIQYSIKGDTRSPSEYVRPHAKALKKLSLTLAKTPKDPDD